MQFCGKKQKVGWVLFANYKIRDWPQNGNQSRQFLTNCLNEAAMQWQPTFHILPIVSCCRLQRSPPLFGKNASMNSAEKYCTVHNFGKTACNLKWAVSPSPRLRRRGPSCGAPPSGRLLSPRGFERCFDWVGAVPWMVPTTGLVPCARARRRSSCHPVASRAGAAVGPQGAVLLEEAIGSSWVAVLLLEKGCSAKVGWASTSSWQLLVFDPVTLSPSVTC